MHDGLWHERQSLTPSNGGTGFPRSGVSPESDVSARPYDLIRAGISCAAILAIVATVAAIAFFLWLGSDQVINHTWNWKSYEKTAVRQWFRLPSELKLISAIEKSPGLMGQEVTVTFRLPNTKTPEAWVKQIANDSGISDDNRETPYRYDGEADYHIVEYHPEKQVYSVMFGWD